MMSDELTSLERQERVALWFDAHATDLGKYVSRRVGSMVAEDLVAETFLTALARFERYDASRAEPRAWLFGIATNLIRKHQRTEVRRLRNQARCLHQEKNDHDPTKRVDEALDAARRYATVLEAVAELTPDERELVLLAGWEELNSNEIARVLSVPASTVRARLRRVRKLLRVGTRPGGHEWMN